MNKLFVPLMLLIVVILVVSIVYIIVSSRHKEKMAMIKRGLQPEPINRQRNLMEIFKWGLFLFSLGLGFLCAFLVDHLVLPNMDATEPLYPAMVGIFGGSALMLFYTLFKRKKE